MRLRSDFSRRGSVTLLFVFFFPVFLCALSMAWDLGRVYTAKVVARHSLGLAVRAAAAEVDQDVLSDPSGPRLAIRKDHALASFSAVLPANLQPYQGALFAGPYQLKFFYVVNDPKDSARESSLSTPFTYSTGGRSVTLAQPAVAAEIAVPLELGPFGAWAAGEKTVDVTVHAAAAPELKH